MNKESDNNGNIAVADESVLVEESGTVSGLDMCACFPEMRSPLHN